jgi:hypothetical protein
MGPTALFDKSFLQSLNLNEAVWFDHFFLANVCPLLFAETLADLAKPERDGRTGEDEVRFIADKSPQMHGAPCAHHQLMAFNNLFGRQVALGKGRIPITGGRRVRVEGKLGTVFEQSPEARAFARWQQGEFKELEHEFAKQWREQLATLDLREATALLKAAGVTETKSKTLEQARAMAASVVRGTDRLADRLRLVLTLLGVRQGLFGPIQQYWSGVGRPPMHLYAPYAAYVVEVEVFFNICLASGLISTERPSNKLDIAYLFYLPFCMVFTSSDKLHRSCAPLFLGREQDFIWGPDLKGELRVIDEHFSALPEETKVLGIMTFAHTPPEFEGSKLIPLWDKHLPRWRELWSDQGVKPSTENVPLVNELRRFEGAPSLPRGDPAYDEPYSDALSIQRFIAKRRGSWYQLPRDLRGEEKAG